MKTEPPAARFRQCGGIAGGKRPNVLSGEFLAEPSRRERTRRAREALLDATLARFAARGYDATTIEEIAKDAGIAVGGFYQHFRSKRQVLLILLDHLLAELESPPCSPRDEAATIIGCIHHRFTSMWQYAGVYRAWREAALRDATLTGIQESIEAWTTGRGAAALNAAAAAPGARRNVDVPTLSYMLSTIFLRLLESSVPDRAALADTVVAMVTHAVFEDRFVEPTEAVQPVILGE
jgi:AcrR family transcriptional regulator